MDFLGLESCPEFVEGIPVKRYGSTPVGGHHIPAKANYNNAPLARQYSLDAPTAPINELKNSNDPATGSALHKEITAAQRRGYDDFAKNFDPDVDTYTWNDVRAIEVEAHTSVGFSQSEADALTDYGIEKLKQQGLPQPTNIPWNPGML